MVCAPICERNYPASVRRCMMSTLIIRLIPTPSITLSLLAQNLSLKQIAPCSQSCMMSTLIIRLIGHLQPTRTATMYTAYFEYDCLPSPRSPPPPPPPHPLHHTFFAGTKPIFKTDCTMQPKLHDEHTHHQVNRQANGPIKVFSEIQNGSGDNYSRTVSNTELRMSCQDC